MHSCFELYEDFGVLTVPSIYIFECSMIVKKHIHMFTNNSDIHKNQTRNCNKLSDFQHKRSIFENGPKYRMVHICNSLPKNIKDVEKVSLFKKRLLKYLLTLNLFCIVLLLKECVFYP
jgi:hypothetical protein